MKTIERKAEILFLVQDTFKTGYFDTDFFARQLNPLYAEDPELHQYYVDVCQEILDVSTKMGMAQKLACPFVTTGRGNELYYEKLELEREGK